MVEFELLGTNLVECTSFFREISAAVNLFLVEFGHYSLHKADIPELIKWIGNIKENSPEYEITTTLRNTIQYNFKNDVNLTFEFLLHYRLAKIAYDVEDAYLKLQDLKYMRKYTE